MGEVLGETKLTVSLGDSHKVLIVKSVITLRYSLVRFCRVTQVNFVKRLSAESAKNSFKTNLDGQKRTKGVKHVDVLLVCRHLGKWRGRRRGL